MAWRPVREWSLSHNDAEAEQPPFNSRTRTLVIEEFLTGEEVSFIVLSDGKDYP